MQYTILVNLLVSKRQSSTSTICLTTYCTVMGVVTAAPKLLSVRRILVSLLCAPPPLFRNPRGPGWGPPQAVPGDFIGVVVGRGKEIWPPAPAMLFPPLPGPFNRRQRQWWRCGGWWWSEPRGTRGLRRRHRYAAQTWQRFFQLGQPNARVPPRRSRTWKKINRFIKERPFNICVKRSYSNTAFTICDYTKANKRIYQ